MQQRLVVDNTNPTRKQRLKYIEAAWLHRFTIIGYYVHSDVATAFACNAKRTGKEHIPAAGIRGT